MVGQAFAANLPRAAAFAHGVDQFDAVGVNDPEHRRRSQESLRPILMRREEAKEPRPLGELGKQRAIVAGQPAIECPVAPAFEGMEQPQGDDLIEQYRDKLDGDHGLLRAWQGVTLSTSMAEVHDQYNKASKYY